MTSSDFFCATVSNYLVQLVVELAHCRVLGRRTKRNMMTDWIGFVAWESGCGCVVGGGLGSRCLGMRLTMETLGIGWNVRIQMWPKLPGPGPAQAGGAGDIHANQRPSKEFLAACQATTLPRTTPLTRTLSQPYLFLPNGLATSPNRQLRQVVILPFYIDIVCSMGLFF
jgi:hypothetical protein